MKINSKILINLTIVFSIVSIYCLIINNNQIFEVIIYLLTIILFALCVINLKNIFVTFKSEPVDRYISLIGLEIALIAFIQTSIQVEKNNKQFEENRIASDSLFHTQLKHAEKLNDSLISELNKIQAINKQQSLIAENQLLSSQQQLDLSQQSLSDYLADTKPEMTYRYSKIINRDTINGNKIKLSIRNFFKNTGERDALNIEMRHAIIHNKKSSSNIFIDTDMNLFSANSSVYSNFYPEMFLSESEDFFYWFQIIYYDKRLDNYINRSYYLHYRKTTQGSDFFYADEAQKDDIRKIIDSKLRNRNLSITTN